MNRRPRAQSLLLGLLAVWSILPLAVLAVVSFSGGWRFPALLGVDPGARSWFAAADGALLSSLVESTLLATATGAVAATVGLPLGRALSGLRGRRRLLAVAGAFLPVAAPPLVVGVGLQYSLLSLGLAGRFSGVLLAHLVPAAGYTSLFFLGVFEAYDRRVEEEARGLGAGPLQTLVRVTLPLLRRPLAEAFVLGFLVSWAQVPLTLLVGQGQVRTLTVQVLSWVQAGQDPLAAAGALVLTIPPLALMTLVALAVRRAEVVMP